MLQPLRPGRAAAAAAALALAAPAAVSAAPAAPALDPAFGDGGVALLDRPEIPTAFAPSRDGGAVVAGYTPSDGVVDVVRLRADGKPDPAFDGDGRTTVSFGPGTDFSPPTAVLVDSAGRTVVVAGWRIGGSPQVAVARLLPDGSLDPAFDGDGRVTFALTPGAGSSSSAHAAALTPGDGVAIAGLTSAGGGPLFNALAVLDAHGAPAVGPQSLGWGADAALKGMAVGADGAIALAGQRTGDALLALRTATGAPAPGFPDPLVQAPGDGSDELAAVAFAPGGGLVAAGLTDVRLSDAEWRVDGLVTTATADGGIRRTTSFAAPGAAAQLELKAVAVADGRTLVGGAVTAPGPTAPIAVAALGGDGLPDAAAGGVQTVALPPAAGRVSVRRFAFDGAARAFALVTAAEEDRRYEGVARIAVAFPGQDGGSGPGPDQRPPPPETPKEGPTPRRPRFAPVAAFSSVYGSRPVKVLGGSVADGARRVEVAVGLRTGRRCRAMTSTRPGFARRATACKPTRWLRASGRRDWRLRLKRPLPRGRYVVWVRAVGARGTTARPFSAKAGNQIAFTVKR
jgi:hypothetical protein